jgi:hypothetical protein
METGMIKETYTQDLADGEYYSKWQEYNLTMDQNNERCAGYILHWNANDSRPTSEFYFVNNDGTTNKNIRLAVQSNDLARVNCNWIETKLDYTGGTWIYFFCQSYHADDFVDTKGYYLAYFDVTMTNKFKWYTANQEINAMDVNYNTREIWYTRNGTHAIYKVTYTGDTEVNYSEDDYTSDLGGIAVLPSGDVIFANAQDLHRLSSIGIYMPEYKLSYIVLDGDGSEAIWAIDGQSVGRLYLYGEKAGTWDFKVDVNLPSSMEAVPGGAWVKCAGESGDSGVMMRYISKENKRIEYEYPLASYCKAAILYESYDHPLYTEKMPVTTDSVWPTLPWNKVNLEGFLTSEDRYYQLRTTFRRQEPIERYPEFVIDSGQDFFSDDNFEQTSSTPNQLLWGNWLNKPSLERIYVETDTNQLVLVNDQGGTEDAYIDTSNRMVVAKGSDGHIDVRVSYKFGDGDGIISGVDENIYIYLFSAQSNYEGKYIATRFKISSSPETSNSTMYSDTGNGSWREEWNSEIGTDYYEGEFRLYWNGTYFYPYVRKDSSSSWAGSVDSEAANTSNLGNYFYVRIVASRNSSILKLNSFNVYNGTAYYYTDTPQVSAIYKQQLVKVEDIYPNNYKNIYFRTYASKDLDITANNELDMKVRWRTPVY